MPFLFEAPSIPSSRHGKARLWLRALAVGLAGVLALTACSSRDKSPGKVVDDTKDDNPDGGTVLSALDSLVEKNKGQGVGVVTGFLTGEGGNIAKGLLKQARNAAGESVTMTRETVPLSGATVLLFNALEPTTAADTTVKTDSTRAYTVLLKEGRYFGFAVWLNLETFELVTTSIDNITPRADTVVKLDTSTAVEDVTAPTVTAVYDATAPNDDNVFLVGNIPASNAKVNITFSEPMNRETAKAVVIGRVDTAASSSSIVLADTLKDVTLTWSGDSKEMTLNVKSMDVDAQYGIVIPVGLKDLAKNALEEAYYATFLTAEAEELAKVAFEVAGRYPAEGEALKPIQNPSVSFNRPVDVFTVMKHAKVDPAMEGYWEVAGSRATFVHKKPLAVGTTYKISLPTDIQDLAGKKLAEAGEFSFEVKDFDGAAKDLNGREQEVALAVEAMFSAYLQGDLGRFGAAFHENFRLYEGDGAVKSKTQFLDDIRRDFGEAVAFRAGFPAPVFDISDGACQDNVARWKVAAEGDAATVVWVEVDTPPGVAPRVWNKEGNLVEAGRIQWAPGGPNFTLDGKKFKFAPDFSKFAGSVNAGASEHDLKFQSEVMKTTSTIVLDPVKLTRKEAFTVDGGLILSGDTAKLAVKMENTEAWSRLNFAPRRGCGDDALEETRYELLKFLVVFNGSRWIVLSIVAPPDEFNKDDFNGNVNLSDFNGGGTPPVNLIAPVNGKDNVADADGNVTFKWQGLDRDSVGGYIFGMAEDGRFTGGRPPFGALIFVKAGERGKEVSFTLDKEAKVVGGSASAILRRAQDLRLPGWERTMFEYVLKTLYKPDSGFAGVYNWKVIAVRDTSPSGFLNTGFRMENFFGESDFGSARGYFAAKGLPQGADFDQFNNQQFLPPAGDLVGFQDSDMDGIPDFMEQKYRTNMHDRNSYPDFRVDTDGDRLADFIERLLDPDGSKGLVNTAAGDEARARLIDELRALGIDWMDSDKDGFPDDVEELLGFNPRDPLNNPGTKARAEAPIGVFKGKLRTQDGQLQTLNFKSYKDSTGKLWSAYTLILHGDTLKDTVRAAMNDLNGEFTFQIILPLDGPDAGRSFLLRGYYESFNQLVRGPCDMIASVAKTSVSFGSGPFVGEWAASAKGEDVSGFLGGGGTAGPGPVNPGPMEYMPPPTGVSEGSVLDFGNGGAKLFNEVQDVVADIPRIEVRPQPDGSVEFFGEMKTESANAHRRVEIGGRISKGAEGWVLHGHVMVDGDSAGRFYSIPGQMMMKASGDDLKVDPAARTLEGSMGGWIQQDEFGTGLTGVGPAPCTDPNQPCDPGPGPVGEFGIPYVNGISQFRGVLERHGITAGATFYAEVQGRMMSVVNDSTHVLAAKAPWCGQVVLKGELIQPTQFPSDADRQRFEDDQRRFSEGGGLMIVLELPNQPGVVAMKDKVLDPTGVVRENVVAVENRFPPLDYGSATMVCGGPQPPLCDPASGSCTQPPPPCDPNLRPCDEPPPCDPNLGPCDQPPPPCDPNLGPCTTQPPPCDPATQTCQQGPVPFKGEHSLLVDILGRTNNTVSVFSGPNTQPVRRPVDPGSIRQDGDFAMVSDATDATKRYGFMGVPNDPMMPQLTPDGFLSVMAPGTNQP